MKHLVRLISSFSAALLVLSIVAAPICSAVGSQEPSEALSIPDAQTYSEPAQDPDASGTQADPEPAQKPGASNTPADPEPAQESETPGTEVDVESIENASAAEAEEELDFSVMPFSLVGDRTADTAGKITVDGKDDDWANIHGVELNSNDGSFALKEWKAATDEDGNVYICITGECNQWVNFDWKGLDIAQNGATDFLPFCGLDQIPGAEYKLTSDPSGTTMGPFILEAFIPAGHFRDPDFRLSFCGASLPSGSLPVLDRKEPGGGKEPEKAVYNGIVIDGKFYDWDAVVKTAGPSCSNEAHPNCVESCAMVFDGDWVYIYIKENKGWNAGGAGSNGNGKFAITTDLGRTLIVDLESDGTVRGIDGADCRHVGPQWEIAIPASQLPPYEQSINFGFYLEEPVITGVVNLDGSSGNAGSFSGIVCDGYYDDWIDYPHTLVQYSTAGTQHNKVDGEIAIYADGSTLFGHAVTEHPSHLTGGYDLSHAITISFNGDRDYKGKPSDGNLYPVLVTVDAAGNIRYPDVRNLPNGTHEFYIMDARGWKATNINNIQHNDIFGKMYITIQDGKEECEYEIDLEKVAKYIGCHHSDFKLIEVQFGRLGPHWASCAGASSGAWLGIVLCLGVVGVSSLILYLKRRKMSKRI